MLGGVVCFLRNCVFVCCEFTVGVTVVWLGGAFTRLSGWAAGGFL